MRWERKLMPGSQSTEGVEGRPEKRRSENRGANTGHTRSHDTSQVWAFRGPARKIERISRILLTG